MSSTQTPNPPSSSPSYIHQFGYHLAKKLLGASHDAPSPFFQNCIPATQRQPPSFFSFYRANWRSHTIKFPWDLSSLSRRRDDNDDDGTVRWIRPETLFVDVTFDFVCVTHSNDDTFNTETGAANTDDNVTPMFTAVRIGALLALPANDEYRHHYLRGDPLTANDVHRHCRQIQVDAENTPIPTLAEMFARSFQSSSSSSWRVVAKSLDSKNSSYRWEMRIGHSGELGGEVAALPLYTGTCGECLGEPLPPRVLDAFLLRGKNEGGECVVARLSEREGRLFWDGGGDDDVRSGWDGKEAGSSRPCGVGGVRGCSREEEEDAAESFYVDDAEMESDARQSNAARSQPPPPVVEKVEANIDRTERVPSSSKCGNRMSRPDYRPRETVMYALGKKTRIAGIQKKKKAKFTLGSL